eukprot:COSAG01_NODE_395_length_17610_cov_20.238764_19_plen_94_part_00
MCFAAPHMVSTGPPISITRAHDRVTHLAHDDGLLSCRRTSLTTTLLRRRGLQRVGKLARLYGGLHVDNAQRAAQTLESVEHMLAAVRKRQEQG